MQISGIVHERPRAMGDRIHRLERLMGHQTLDPQPLAEAIQYRTLDRERGAVG